VPVNPATWKEKIKESWSEVDPGQKKKARPYQKNN
jgi:hypothetical protein